MGSVRTCDHRCHRARNSRCACWCRGLFHGVSKQAARDALVKELGALPRTEEELHELFRKAGIVSISREEWESAQSRQNERPLTTPPARA